MASRSKRFGFTLVELLVVMAIFVILIGLLLPAISASREADRRTQCINKVHQLGVAMHNYASTNNTFPPSSSMTTVEGTTRRVDGWSFLDKLLPYTEYMQMYKWHPNEIGPTGVQGLIATNGACQSADQTQVPDFICPSNSNKHFVNASANPPTGACTNYKAMSATTEASLEMCVDPSGKPPYGEAKQHPDGALYPGRFIPLADFKDGLSHTIMLMETQDDKYSRWIVGAEASLVGLPPNINATLVYDSVNRPYYCPSMFDDTFGYSSAVAKAGLRTFLAYDFSPGGRDRGAYAKDQAGDPGWDTTIPNANMYGPSSGHPAVINVTFADGFAKGLSKQVDAACLFFMITRAGGDPMP